MERCSFPSTLPYPSSARRFISSAAASYFPWYHSTNARLFTLVSVSDAPSQASPHFSLPLVYAYLPPPRNFPCLQSTTARLLRLRNHCALSFSFDYDVGDREGYEMMAKTPNLKGLAPTTFTLYGLANKKVKCSRARLAHFSVQDHLKSKRIIQSPAKDFFLENAEGHR